jgi:hypothetical protein
MSRFVATAATGLATSSRSPSSPCPKAAGDALIRQERCWPNGYVFREKQQDHGVRFQRRPLGSFMSTIRDSKGVHADHEAESKVPRRGAHKR